MPSVVGLLEQRELGARRRVDELWEEADRIQAELAVTEREWKEWAIVRSRVGEVLCPAEETGQDHTRADRTAPAAEERSGKASRVPDATKVKLQCRCGARGWPGRRCRWTTSAPCRRSWPGTGCIKCR